MVAKQQGHLVWKSDLQIDLQIVFLIQNGLELHRWNTILLRKSVETSLTSLAAPLVEICPRQVIPVKYLVLLAVSNDSCSNNDGETLLLRMWI
ncbi:hypothetical protein NPIL_167341 [Nephila pilipes]|uniref:Uncharacterized protein n=1 Tax=Nephila pilipes TaxID=299642 RepID=A0A8X6T4X1_NEPPI|nr:hypothetical protein NPIL_167341 [Nephila pilipes]